MKKMIIVASMLLATAVCFGSQSSTATVNNPFGAFGAQPRTSYPAQNSGQTINPFGSISLPKPTAEEQAFQQAQTTITNASKECTPAGYSAEAHPAGYVNTASYAYPRNWQFVGQGNAGYDAYAKCMATKNLPKGYIFQIGTTDPSKQ